MNKKPEDLRPYRRYGMTLLQFMLLVGVLGLVGTAILYFLLA